MQQPPQYPYGPPPYNQPPYQQPYPTQYPYQPPPQPARPPSHGAVYWILFILFFPITVPFVILKAIATSGRRQPMPGAPYPQQPVHQHHPRPAPHRHQPSFNSRVRKVNRGLRSVNRTLRWMTPKSRTHKW